MGKDSLLKPTSEGKGTKGKGKNKASSKKKDAKKKGDPKKVDVQSSETPPVAKEAAPKKKLTMEELIHKKFDAWKPEKLYVPELDENYLKNFTAPPFFDNATQEETDRIRGILLRQYTVEELKAATEKAATEKAATEKAAAEKAAAEKAAAEKAAAEKAAAEKAAAEKAAAEKAAAEKAAAEKAAAEKAAAEKAAAEKAAAEKAAAEKAAAEKAAAERKAAAKAALEKAAAEQAAAERAASERAIVEKAAVEKKAASNQMRKTVITLAAGLIFILFPILMTSTINAGKYYVEVSKGTVEIWKGKFSPSGKELVLSLYGVQPPETLKQNYSKKEVFPLALGYYLKRAEELLDVKGIPNFEEIRSDLKEAFTYALTKQDRKLVSERLAKMDLTILLYKADSAVARGTASDLKSAMKYLKKAKKLDLNASEAQLLEKKLASIQQLMDAPKSTVRKLKESSTPTAIIGENKHH